MIASYLKPIYMLHIERYLTDINLGNYIVMFHDMGPYIFWCTKLGESYR